MSRNKLVLVVLVIFYIIIGIVSCAKKQSPDTAFGWVLGKWKLAKTATDNGDGNGTLGAYTPVQKGQDWIWTFNSDATATELNNYNASPDITINYNWKVINGDSLWMATSGAGHDTTTYYIVNVNSSEMFLTWMNTINGTRVINGYDFVKQ